MEIMFEHVDITSRHLCSSLTYVSFSSTNMMTNWNELKIKSGVVTACHKHSLARYASSTLRVISDVEVLKQTEAELTLATNAAEVDMLSLAVQQRAKQPL